MASSRKRVMSTVALNDDKEVCQRRPSACFQIFKPLMFAIMVSMLGAFNSVIVKSLHYISLPKITLFRGLGTLVLNMPSLIHCTRIKGTLRRSDIPNLMFRGMTGACMVGFNFMSWKLMPIADSGVILSTSPVWVIILSRIVLKENLDLLNSLSIAFTMLGLVLLSRLFSFAFISPSDKYSDLNYWYGSLCALSSSIFLAVGSVFLRKMKNVPNPVIAAFQSVFLFSISAIAVLVQWDWSFPKCGLDGALLVILGLISLIGELLNSAAFKLDKASAVSSVRTSGQMAFQFILQVSIFNEVPDVYSILATVCVFVSLWLSGLRKYRQEKRRRKAQKKDETQSPEAVTSV